MRAMCSIQTRFYTRKLRATSNGAEGKRRFKFRVFRFRPSPSLSDREGDAELQPSNAVTNEIQWCSVQRLNVSRNGHCRVLESLFGSARRGFLLSPALTA